MTVTLGYTVRDGLHTVTTAAYAQPCSSGHKSVSAGCASVEDRGSCVNDVRAARYAIALVRPR